jgi:hypothetical protein
MKTLVNILLKKNYIYRSLKEIDKKSLGTRKKIDIYEGVDTNAYYAAIFNLVQKSRFLHKNANELEILYEKLKVVQDHNFKKKILIYQMPICSHAKEQLKQNGWIVINASV